MGKPAQALAACAAGGGVRTVEAGIVVRHRRGCGVLAGAGCRAGRRSRRRCGRRATTSRSGGRLGRCERRGRGAHGRGWSEPGPARRAIKREPGNGLGTMVEIADRSPAVFLEDDAVALTGEKGTFQPQGQRRRRDARFSCARQAARSVAASSLPGRGISVSARPQTRIGNGGRGRPGRVAQTGRRTTPIATELIRGEVGRPFRCADHGAGLGRCP